MRSRAAVVEGLGLPGVVPQGVGANYKLSRCGGTALKDPARRCCRVEKGSWIVKQAVGQNTPVLLGKKLTTKYFTGSNYIEVGGPVTLTRSCAGIDGTPSKLVTHDSSLLLTSGSSWLRDAC